MNNGFHCALQKNKPSLLTATAVDDRAGSSDAINLQKALVLDEEIIISAMRPASIFLSFDFTIL